MQGTRNHPAVGGGLHVDRGDVGPALAAPVGKTEPDFGGIPDDPASPMLVCVSTTTDPEGESWCFAGWVSEETGYTGLMAVFPERNLVHS